MSDLETLILIVIILGILILIIYAFAVCYLIFIKCKKPIPLISKNNQNLILKV